LPTWFMPFPSVCDSTCCAAGCNICDHGASCWPVSRWTEINSNICNPINPASTEVCTHQVLFWSVNCCVIYINLGPWSESP
jgi:hypothetical protein